MEPALDSTEPASFLSFSSPHLTILYDSDSSSPFITSDHGHVAHSTNAYESKHMVCGVSMIESKLWHIKRACRG